MKSVQRLCNKLVAGGPKAGISGMMWNDGIAQSTNEAVAVLFNQVTSLGPYKCTQGSTALFRGEMRTENTSIFDQFSAPATQGGPEPPDCLYVCLDGSQMAG